MKVSCWWIRFVLALPATQAWTASTTTTTTTTTGPRQPCTTLYSTSVPLSSTSTEAPADERYYSYVESPLQTQSTTAPRITLTRYLDQALQEQPHNAELAEMTSLLLAVQMACKTISNLVHRAGLNRPNEVPKENYADGRYYSMQRLDQLSTAVLKNALKFTGKCIVSTPQIVDAADVANHQPGVLLAKSLDSNLVACLDPLDGSGNADASICTGTVFGVFHSQSENDDDKTPEQDVLQPASKMRAAGYCLYSSATVLVFTLGNGVQGFTLDPQTQEFVLSHSNLTIPTRGNVYSCNEANAHGWDSRIQEYFDTIKRGVGQSKQRYALRYVGSLVGDVHRTLLYGGLFAYPSDTHAHPDGNLQLLYKTAPLAMIVAAAGGLALDQNGNNLLQVTPCRVHAKSPCFLGSADDIRELQEYLK